MCFPPHAFGERRWCSSLQSGCSSGWQQCTEHTVPKAAQSAQETVPLPFLKVRFNSVPSLHLDRKPKQVICFISQMATFSDLHWKRAFRFQSLRNDEGIMSQTHFESSLFMAWKLFFLNSEDVKMGHSSHKFIFGKKNEVEKSNSRLTLLCEECHMQLSMTEVWRKKHLSNAFKAYLKASNKTHIRQKWWDKNHFFM